MRPRALGAAQHYSDVQVSEPLLASMCARALLALGDRGHRAQLCVPLFAGGATGTWSACPHLARSEGELAERHPSLPYVTNVALAQLVLGGL